MKKKVLFLCTHNSCRSQMAEGIMKAIYENKYDVYSAGTNPSFVQPLAIKVLNEINADISHNRSKHLNELVNISFDYVITLCSSKGICPSFPGAKKYIHKEFTDPSQNTGSSKEKLAAYIKVRDEIKDWISENF